MAVKVSADADRLEKEQQKEGSKAGIEMLKLERTLAQQREIANRQTKKGS
jgi:hypothetical protein